MDYLNKPTITFDIETAYRKDLSAIEMEEFERKLKKKLRKDMTLDEKYQAESELRGTNPYFGKIVTIGVRSGKGEESKSKALVGDEDVILNDFWNIIRNFRGTFVSFNGLGFDINYIVVRTMVHGIKPTCENFLTTKRYQRYPHFDVGAIICDWNNYKMPSMRLACEALGLPSPKEGEIKAENVAEAYYAGRIDDIAKYCLRDVESTYQLFRIVSQYA